MYIWYNVYSLPAHYRQNFRFPACFAASPLWAFSHRSKEKLKICISKSRFFRTAKIQLFFYLQTFFYFFLLFFEVFFDFFLTLFIYHCVVMICIAGRIDAMTPQELFDRKDVSQKNFFRFLRRNVIFLYERKSR